MTRRGAALIFWHVAKLAGIPMSDLEFVRLAGVIEVLPGVRPADAPAPSRT